MAESSLGKVLRLAGGYTRSYVRRERGRLVQVNQYKTPTVGMQANFARAPVTHGPAQFSQLATGQLVTVGNQTYRVGSTNLAGHAAGYTGKPNAVRNGGMAAKQQPLLGTPEQNPVFAALRGAPLPTSTPTVTHQLIDTKTHKGWYVTLPANYTLNVV